MFSKYRVSLHLLLSAAVLFLQIALAFHHHDPGENIHCESHCELSVHSQEEAHEDTCQYTIFYFANIASDPLGLVTTLPAVTSDMQHIPDAVQADIRTILVSWDSRAPPSL